MRAPEPQPIGPDRSCETCQHWKGPDPYGYGQCRRLQQELTVELITGWDGGCVDYIETPGDFGCSLWEAIP